MTIFILEITLRYGLHRVTVPGSTGAVELRVLYASLMASQQVQLRPDNPYTPLCQEHNTTRLVQHPSRNYSASSKQWIHLHAAGCRRKNSPSTKATCKESGNDFLQDPGAQSWGSVLWL